MIQKLKNYLKLSILFFGISTALTSCSNDDKAIINEKNDFIKSISHTTYFSIKKNPLLEEKTSRFIKSKNQMNRISSDSIEFTIDTTVVQVIESQIYTSYTFKVDMFNEVENELNNYVLTLYNDNSFKQMLVTYPIIGDDDYSYYNMDNIIAQPIDGNILYSARAGNCNGYTVTTWQETCVTYNCSLGAGHTGSNDGGYWVDPYEVCEGAWVHNCVEPESFDPPPGGSTGGGSTPQPDEDEDPPIAIIPFEGLGQRDIDRECRKISDLLTENPEYKTKLLQLAAQAQNATFEKGIAIDVNGDEIVIPDGVAGKIEPPLNPSERYMSIAHIHDAVGNEGNGTFSVPSLMDLGNLGYISLINDKIRLNKMVYFLFTADGTYYALTINSSSKFRTFWVDQKFLYDNPSLTDEQRQAFQKIFEDRGQQNNNGIYYRYYENKNGSLIDETATDYEQQLKHFLNFLNEDGGMGISVFETDAQLSQFTLVQLNEASINGEPKRDTCN